MPHEGMCRYLKLQSFGRLLRAKNKAWSWLVYDCLLRLVLGANCLQAAPVLCLGKSHWEQAGNQLTFKQFGYSDPVLREILVPSHLAL